MLSYGINGSKRHFISARNVQIFLVRIIAMYGWKHKDYKLLQVLFQYRIDEFI